MMQVVKTVKSEEIGLDWFWYIYKLKNGYEVCECFQYILNGSCPHIEPPPDDEFVKEFKELKFKEYQGLSPRFNLQKHTLSPIPLRPYGVELEGGVSNKELLKKTLRKQGLKAYLTGYNGGQVNDYIAIGEDNSLEDLQKIPIEITTPKLIGWGNKRYGFKLVEIILKQWNKIGAEINETCGCHVTVSTHDFDDLDYQRLVVFFYLSQPFLFNLVSDTRWDNSYCTPITPQDIKYFNNYAEKKCKALNISRGYYGLFRRSRRVEFRLYQGTTCINEVRAFTLLSLSIVDTVKNHWDEICKFFENLNYKELKTIQFSKWLNLLKFNNHPIKKLAKLQLRFFMNCSEYDEIMEDRETEYYRTSIGGAFVALYEEDPNILTIFNNPCKIERKIKKYLKEVSYV